MTIMASFMTSELYRRIQQAVILGREVPFVIPWEQGQIMEGVIDLVYRLDGRVWIADYKTDHISAEEAEGRARQYAQQARVYRVAAERCLKEPVQPLQFVFLRPGVNVAI
jgi:ATP-dependent helicase/nuclease subunit A